MRFLILGRSVVGIEQKKVEKSLEIRGLAPQYHKHEPKINMAEKLLDVIVKLRQRNGFLYVVIVLIFQIKILFKVKNGLITGALFFGENAKNLGRADNA